MVVLSVFHCWWLSWVFFVVDGCVECFSLLMVVLGVFHCWWLCWVFFTADGCVECFSLLMVVLGDFHCWRLCWVFFIADGCAGCFSLLAVVLGVFHCWWFCWVFQDEVEVVLKAKTASWIGFGWRPAGKGPFFMVPDSPSVFPININKNLKTTTQKHNSSSNNNNNWRLMHSALPHDVTLLVCVRTQYNVTSR